MLNPVRGATILVLLIAFLGISRLFLVSPNRVAGMVSNVLHWG
jgi:hypothetical protein